MVSTEWQAEPNLLSVDQINIFALAESTHLLFLDPRRVLFSMVIPFSDSLRNVLSYSLIYSGWRSEQNQI